MRRVWTAFHTFLGCVIGPGYHSHSQSALALDLIFNYHYICSDCF